jgi:putative transcriptional regulator
MMILCPKPHNKNPMQESVPPQAGKVLISDPFLPDANFNRTVILLLEHNEHGTFGLVLNHKLESALSDVLDDLPSGKSVPLFKGGPVQLDTLHYIHLGPSILPGAKEVITGLFWGGDFDMVKMQVSLGMAHSGNFRFFLGYSGWGDGQLDKEIEEGSWIVSSINPSDLFELDSQSLWKKCMLRLGGECALLANAPGNPHWN